MSDRLSFFRAWLADPLRVAAVLPSGRSLARLMADELSAASAPVIELGAGTGAVTEALLARGIPEQELALVENGSDFARLLSFRYPDARTLWMDARKIGDVKLAFPSGRRVGAVVSGLPVLTMTPEAVTAILTGAFAQMRPQGAFYQFTYTMRCPIPRSLLDGLGLEARRVGVALANVPPAAVYRIGRQAG